MNADGSSGPLDISLRKIEADDAAFHREMVYIALWDPEGTPPRPRSVLEHPRVRAHYSDWGDSDDTGFIAEANGERVGLISCRLKDSVTEEFQDLPELGISVLPGYQRKGIGRTLMEALIAKTKDRYLGLRLGVHPENAVAIGLYEKMGFKIYAHPEGQYPQMVLRFDALEQSGQIET